MREICFVGIGESVKKLNYKLGIDINLNIEEDYVFDSRYIELKGGDGDIQIVRNYRPYFVTSNISLDKLLNKGYSVEGVCGKSIVYYKASGVKYSVKPMDTLEELANKFGVSENELITINKLKTKKLFVGQVLYI